MLNLVHQMNEYAQFRLFDFLESDGGPRYVAAAEALLHERVSWQMEFILEHYLYRATADFSRFADALDRLREGLDAGAAAFFGDRTFDPLYHSEEEARKELDASFRRLTPLRGRATH